MSKILINETDIFYNTALNYTKKAGELILSRIHESKTIETKSNNIDFVTESDQEVENLLVDGLKSQFPDHEFIGEEMVSSGAPCDLTDKPTWVIDPIDGTMNFIHSFPFSCISVCLYVNKIPEVAIIYNPVMDQLYSAKRGGGAFLNDKPIKVSGKTKLSEALVASEFGSSREPKKMDAVFENFKILSTQTHGFRCLGSGASDLAMLASGAVDAYYEFGMHVWDIAAGELLVKEAGGVVIDPSGGPFDRMSRRILAASTQELAEELSKQLVQYHPQPRDADV